MIRRYSIDPSIGRFTAQAHAAGLLSALGHSPTFAVGRYRGTVRFQGDDVGSMELDLTIDADSLSLSDPVKPSDRQEIEGRMRRDVLETSSFAEITYRASCVSYDKADATRFRMRIEGPLSLHGVEVRRPIDLELRIAKDGIRLRGDSVVRLSEHGIRPVTALAGAIRLKDEVRIDFDVAALVEAES
jgi:polyisoprenoid-binding protein YceI